MVLTKEQIEGLTPIEMLAKCLVLGTAAILVAAVVVSLIQICRGGD